jgi:hypothetical protein
MSYKIRLPALLASHPLAFLASLGFLRKITEWDSDAQLSFEMQDDWIAVIHSSAASGLDELVERLADWVSSDVFDRLLRWSNDVRVSTQELSARLSSALSEGDLELAGFLSAIVAEGAVDAQKGLAKPSAFYMASGQQSFLDGMRDIVGLVRAAPKAAFQEALIGPWRYKLRAHSLGWDPNTERLHALRHKAPTTEKPVCIGGAVILAFWALPLFPAVARDWKCITTGFVRDGSQQYFAWPIWTTPTNLDELTSFLHAGEGAWIDKRTGRVRPGIRAIYRSRRAEFGQGYAVLRAAEVTHFAAGR